MRLKITLKEGENRIYDKNRVLREVVNVKDGKYDGVHIKYDKDGKTVLLEENYKAGSWDVTPSTENAITGSATYTYTYVQKASITPTVSIEGWTYGEAAKAPSVNGNTGNGIVTYTYAKKGTTDFSSTVPSAAGEYTVKAVIAETDDYLSAEATADFTIAKANAAMTAPTAKSLTYNGQAQELVTAGEADGGTMYYALGENATTAPTDENLYTTSIPTATDAGT